MMLGEDFAILSRAMRARVFGTTTRKAQNPVKMLIMMQE